ncbi:MAG: MMPL family transporter [Pseudomonadota bacterium]
MSSSLIDFYDRLVLARPVLVLILCGLLVGGFATQLGKITLDASADSLVLEGDSDLDFFRENAQRYASEEFLVITFQPEGDLLGDASLETLGALRDDLAGIPGVSSTTTILDVPLLQSPPISLTDVSSGLPTLESANPDREQVREEFRNSPIYANLLVSPDGRTAAIQVNIAGDPRYQALLQAREELRQRQSAADFSTAEAAQLVEAEADFKAYSVVASERSAALVATVRDTVDRYRDRAQLFVGGVPMIAADMVSFVRSDLVTFGGGILLFMLVVLALIFRQPRWVILPMITCATSAIVMLGLLGWLDWRMTVISSNFVALLLIVTLAVAIHLVVRYRELHAGNPNAEQRWLVRETVRLMVIPCFYTSITTAVAFVSLVVSGLRPVIDFGWMMTTGIAVSLALTFVLMPAMMALLSKGSPPAVDTQESGLTQRFADITERFGAQVMLAALVLALASGYGISQLKVENRFIDYFHESTEIYRGMELLDAQLGGTIPLDVVITAPPETALEPVFQTVSTAEEGATSASAQTLAGDDGDPGFDADSGEAVDQGFDEDFEDSFNEGFDDSFADDGFSDDGFDEGFGEGFGEEEGFGETAQGFQQSYWFTRRGMEQVERIHDYIDAQPETGKVLSLATTYDVLKLLLGEDIGDVELALVQKSLPEDISRLLINPYYDEATQQVRISLRVKETSRELRRDQFLKDLRSHLINDMELAEDQLQFTNMLVLYNNVLQSLFTSQILTLGAVFAAILLMFLVLFRSLWLALIALAPNILAAGIVLGIMGLAGIPLDIMTITIAAIVVGIGVDHAIHYVHRFKREFPIDRDYIATMYRCHDSIGKALYYTSITVIAGFSILALSNFTPSIYFGLLTGLAMFAAVVGSLLLLPQLIISFKPLGKPAATSASGAS